MTYTESETRFYVIDPIHWKLQGALEVCAWKPRRGSPPVSTLNSVGLFFSSDPDEGFTRRS